MPVATGNALLIGLARELEYGVPNEAATLEYLKPVLPASIGLNRTEGPSGEVNQSGFAEAGVPGPIAGAFDFGATLGAGKMLLYLEHVLRKVTKTNPTTGVYKYVFEPDLNGVDTSLFGIAAMPPIDQHRIYGVKLNGLSFAIGNNNAIPVRLQGFVSHGTRVGAAEEEGTITGTYPYVPVVRGLLQDMTLPVFVRVSSTSPLQVKVEQVASGPTFAGAALTLTIDPVTGRGVYTNLVGDDGLDLGYWAENYDPFELIFPGDQDDFDLLAVGDTWKFDPTWTLPTASYLTGQRFMSAHQKNRFREIGAGTWSEFRNLTSQVNLPWPLSPDQGSGSKYYYALDRDGLMAATLQYVRKHTSTDFVEFLEQHKRFEFQVGWYGRQLDTGGIYRESIEIEGPSAAVRTLTRPAQNDRAIQETFQIALETNAAGDPPLTVTVYTDRDFTVAT